MSVILNVVNSALGLHEHYLLVRVDLVIRLHQHFPWYLVLLSLPKITKQNVTVNITF